MTGRSKHTKLLSRLQTINLAAMKNQRKTLVLPKGGVMSGNKERSPRGSADELKERTQRDIKAELMAKNFFLEKLSHMN